MKVVLNDNHYLQNVLYNFPRSQAPAINQNVY
jgi:hypothetical protein